MNRILGIGVLLTICGCASPVVSPPVAVPTPPAAAPMVAVAPTPAPPAAVPTAAPPAARQLPQDETITLASGSTLTVSKGWFVTEDKDLLVLQDPDRQIRLGNVELGAADRGAAVAAGWARFQPGFALQVARTVEMPARDGWDAASVITYVIPDSENRRVQAIARRRGATWYVWFVDGDKAALDRRRAQAMTPFTSFRPAGLQKESFAGRVAHPFDAAKQQLLSAFIEQARQDAEVPGLAIGVVQGGKLVWQRAFGVKDRDDKKPSPVTPATLFMIGSTTKPLTTLMMARLIDRGVFTWTTPVTQLLPSFALGDAELTRKVTMQHTVCACSGVHRYDMRFMFEYAGVTPEDNMTKMGTLVPTTGFGETFQYSNMMVAAGGFVAAHAAKPANNKKLGPAYDEAMHAEVFRPLGMRATTFDFAKVARANHAAPHAPAMDLTRRRIPLGWEEGVLGARPAGGAWSNVRDMSRYLMVELGKGVTPEGKRVVSEANLLQRRQPQVKMDADASYGLGLMMSTDHGVTLVRHGGNNFGYSTDMYLLPEHGIGVIVLTNAGSAAPFLAAVRRRLFELLFDGKAQAAEDLATMLANDKAAHKELTDRIKPEVNLDLVGEYTNDLLGKLSVRMNGTEMVVDVGEWQSPAVKKIERDGSEKLLTTAPARRLEFAVGPRTLTLKMPQQEYAFAKAGAAAAP